MFLNYKMFFKLLKISTLTCLICCCNLVFANDDDIQKLLQKIEKASDNEKSEIYRQLCILDSISSNLAITYANKAVYYATKQNQDEELFYSKIVLGNVYLENSDFSNALEAYSAAEKLLKSNYKPRDIFILYANFGIIFYNTNKYDLALDYYLKSLDYAKILNDTKIFTNIYNNIANTYIEKEDYDNSIKFYSLALEEAKKEKDNYYAIAVLYNNLGYLYQEQKKYDLALLNYNEAFTNYEKSRVFHGIAVILNNIADLKLNTGDYIGAEKYLLKADSIHKKYNYRASRQNFYNTAYNVYYNLKNYEKAFYFLDQYHILKDSIYSEELDDKINQITTEYKVDKLKSDSEQKDYKIHKQRQINIILYVIIFAILTFIIVLTIIIKQKVKLNKKLSILNEKLTDAYKDINDNLSYSRQIQLACMQSENIVLPDNLYILDLPKSIVGGDFYLIKEQNKRKYIVLGDCTGHGSFGGFLSVLSIQYLNLAFEQLSEITDILNFLNNNFYKYISQSHFLKNESLCISVLCIEDNIVKYAGSKHKLWKYNFSENQIYEYKTDKEEIGKNENIDFCLNLLEVEKNDMIYLSSDGFPDQFGGENKEKLKYHRFRDLLLKASTKALDEGKDFLCSELNKWKFNEEQTDDILLIGIKF